ncbi:MAG: TonB-dependent receptor, partial [Prevotella sp.]|nr:TonB-dependent receptor [Prevotella sp.]
LTVALSYSGPLRGRFKTKTYTEGKDYITRTMMSANIQSVGVSLTWKFGNVGKQFRQVQSRINNDFMEKSQGSTTSSPMDGKGVER